MAEVSAGLQAEVVETEEQPFVPGAKVVKAVLVAEKKEEPYLPPTTPTPQPTLDKVVESVKAWIPSKKLVLDIETTGIMPFDSRVICMSAMDVTNPDSIVTFQDENEEKMINDFITFFESHQFNQIIGYNTDFDYRFVFTKCMKYGVRAVSFAEAKIVDVMDFMKKAKTDYVPTMNKSGTLEEWAEYILGRTKSLTIEQIFDLWEKREIDPVINYNREDVMMVFELWMLIQYVRGEL